MQMVSEELSDDLCLNLEHSPKLILLLVSLTNAN